MKEVTFYANDLYSGKEVSGYYFENMGEAYITTKDETIQPPIRRMFRVDKNTVRFEIN